MNRGEPPVCAVRNEDLTVEHVLLSCCRYGRTPRNCRLSETLSDVLGGQETHVERLFIILKRYNATVNC